MYSMGLEEWGCGKTQRYYERKAKMENWAVRLTAKEEKLWRWQVRMWTHANNQSTSRRRGEGRSVTESERGFVCQTLQQQQQSGADASLHRGKLTQMWLTSFSVSLFTRMHWRVFSKMKDVPSSRSTASSELKQRRSLVRKLSNGAFSIVSFASIPQLYFGTALLSLGLPVWGHPIPYPSQRSTLPASLLIKLSLCRNPLGLIYLIRFVLFPQSKPHGTLLPPVIKGSKSGAGPV